MIVVRPTYNRGPAATILSGIAIFHVDLLYAVCVDDLPHTMVFL
jgi:hypothetical protein